MVHCNCVHQMSHTYCSWVKVACNNLAEKKMIWGKHTKKNTNTRLKNLGEAARLTNGINASCRRLREWGNVQGTISLTLSILKTRRRNTFPVPSMRIILTIFVLEKKKRVITHTKPTIKKIP